MGVRGKGTRGGCKKALKGEMKENRGEMRRGEGEGERVGHGCRGESSKGA